MAPPRALPPEFTAIGERFNQGERVVVDLIIYWYDILISTVAPIWLRGVAVVVLTTPLMLAFMALVPGYTLLRYRRSQKALACQHGWRWCGGHQFSGRISSDVPWEGGCIDGDDASRCMTWSVGPLPMDTRHRLMLISRLDYEITRQRASEIPHQPPPELTLIDELASVALGVALRGAKAQIDWQRAQPECRRDLWIRDPQMRDWPLGSSDFQRHFAVVCNSSEFARRVITRRLEESLLALPVSADGRFKAYLRSNRLTLDAATTFADDTNLVRFIEIGIMIADEAVLKH